MNFSSQTLDANPVEDCAWQKMFIKRQERPWDLAEKQDDDDIEELVLKEDIFGKFEPRSQFFRPHPTLF